MSRLQEIKSQMEALLTERAEIEQRDLLPKAKLCAGATYKARTTSWQKFRKITDVRHIAGMVLIFCAEVEIMPDGSARLETRRLMATESRDGLPFSDSENWQPSEPEAYNRCLQNALTELHEPRLQIQALEG